MMIRYNPSATARKPPQRHLKPVQGIPKGAKLISVSECAIALKENFPIGSVGWVRSQIRNQWVEGVHYVRLGTGKRARIGIYLDAVLETMRSGV